LAPLPPAPERVLPEAGARLKDFAAAKASDKTIPIVPFLNAAAVFQARKHAVGSGLLFITHFAQDDDSVDPKSLFAVYQAVVKDHFVLGFFPLAYQKPLPKLDYSDGIPVEATTLVAIPALLLTEKQTRKLVNDGKRLVCEETQQHRLAIGLAEFVQRFVKATYEGIYWALKNPEKAFEMYMKRNPDQDKDKAWGEWTTGIDMFGDVAKRAQTPLQLAWMDPAKVKKTVDVVGDLYKLESPVKPDDVYTNKFAEQLR